MRSVQRVPVAPPPTLEDLLEPWASTPARRWSLLLSVEPANLDSTTPWQRWLVADLVDTAWHHAVALDPDGAAHIDADEARQALVRRILRDWPQFTSCQ